MKTATVGSLEDRGWFKGKCWEVVQYAEAEVMKSGGPSMTRLEGVSKFTGWTSQPKLHIFKSLPAESEAPALATALESNAPMAKVHLRTPPPGRELSLLGFWNLPPPLLRPTGPPTPPSRPHRTSPVLPPGDSLAALRNAPIPQHPWNLPSRSEGGCRLQAFSSSQTGLAFLVRRAVWTKKTNPACLWTLQPAGKGTIASGEVQGGPDSSHLNEGVNFEALWRTLESLAPVKLLSEALSPPG